MTVHWLPSRERWRQLEPMPRAGLPWAVPEVSKPTFVAPGYLALPEGTPVPQGEFTTWARDLREEPPLPPEFVVEPDGFGEVDPRGVKVLTAVVVFGTLGALVGWTEWRFTRDEFRVGLSAKEWALGGAIAGGGVGALAALLGK